MPLPSWAGSVALHVAGVAALFLFRSPEVLKAPRMLMTTAIVPAQKLTAPPAAKAMGGGGGGEDRRPARYGRPPRVMDLVFVRPTTKPTEMEPALPIEPAILAAPPLQTAAIQLGDPLGLPGPPSDGTGSRGGIGGGHDGGVGRRAGPRAGDGDDTKGAYSLSAVSTAPVLIHKIEPEYSDEARKARFSGAVVLRIVIDTNGHPTNVEVLRSPGLGLDERAVRSVLQWRFRPGRRDGKPVPVWATVEVNFSVL